MLRVRCLPTGMRRISCRDLCGSHDSSSIFVRQLQGCAKKRRRVFLCFRAREPAANERHRRCRSDVRTNKTRPDQKTDQAGPTKARPTGQNKTRPDTKNKTGRTNKIRPAEQNKQDQPDKTKQDLFFLYFLFFFCICP